MLTALLTVPVMLVGCGGHSAQNSPSPAREALTTTVDALVPSTPAPAAAPATRPPRSEKWIALKVGDCLSDPPPSDPSIVIVMVVDCAAGHAAEVYARVPVAVNAAVADVADRECAAGFTGYIGQTVATSPFTITYLIDSNQDRTVDNPWPSTVICLLQGAGGGPLTGSARH